MKSTPAQRRRAERLAELGRERLRLELELAQVQRKIDQAVPRAIEAGIGKALIAANLGLSRQAIGQRYRVVCPVCGAEAGHTTDCPKVRAGTAAAD